MKYEILEHNNSSLLEKEVNEYIGLGWVPQGGISTVEAGMESYYCQAMIKEN